MGKTKRNSRVAGSAKYKFIIPNPATVVSFRVISIRREPSWNANAQFTFRNFCLLLLRPGQPNNSILDERAGLFFGIKSLGFDRNMGSGVNASWLPSEAE